MELKCPKCGIPHRRKDIFCSRCGTRIRPGNGDREPDDSFRQDVSALLKTLNEFRSWIDQRKKINVRFMQAYKEIIDKEIGPAIRQFDKKYGSKEEGRSPLFILLVEILSWLGRPVTFMQTRLRPSVGMGVWQERWMLTKAVEDYLKECCQEVDRCLNELMKKME